MIDDSSSSSSTKRIRVAKVLKPKTALNSRLSRLKNMDLVFSLFSFSFLFSFQVIFHVSISRTLGLGVEVISHIVTSVTSDGMVTTFDYGT